MTYLKDNDDQWTHQVEDAIDLDPAGQDARGSNIRHGDGIDTFGMACAIPEAVEIQ